MRLIAVVKFFSGKRIFRIASLLLAGLLVWLFSGQQVVSPSPVPESLLQRGQRLWVAGKQDSAYTVFRQAGHQAVAVGDTFAWVQSLRQAGKYLARNGYPDQAARTLDSAISLAPVVGPLYPDILLARCERADVEALRGNLALTVDLYRGILSDCQALPPGQDSLQGIVLEWYAQAQANNDQLDSALVNAREALAIFTRLFPDDHLEIAYARNNLAVIYSYLDEPETAIRYLEQSLSILSKRLGTSHSQTVRVRNNISAMYRDVGLPWQALETLRGNLSALDSIAPAAQFSVLYQHAVNLVSVGDYRTALRSLNRLEVLLTELPGLRPDGLSLLSYERSAAYQSLEKYDSALVYIDATLAHDEKMYGHRSSQLTMDYLRKGDILSRLDRETEALQAIQTALSIAEQHLEPFALRKGWIWESMGEIYLKQARPQEALACFRHSVHIYQHLEAKWNFTDSYRGMANAWRELGNADSNLFYLREAWKYVAPDQPFQAAPETDVLGYWPLPPVAALLRDQGASMEWRYSLSGNPSDLQAALACYRAEISISDSLRHYFESTASQQYVAGKQLTGVEKALRISMTLFGLTGDQSLLESAFVMAEKNKASLLRDHTTGQYALRFAGVPDSLLRREHYLRQRLAYLQVPDKSENWTDEDLDAGRKEAFALYAQYHQFVRNLEKNYPRYYRLKFPDSHFSTKEVMPLLPEGTAMYSYFWGKESVYVFRLFDGKLTVSTVKSDSLAKDFDPWLAFVSHPPGQAKPEALQKVVARLSLTLLPDVSAGMQRLVIIPSGRMAYLPFESLTSAAPRSGSLRAWDFIGKTYALSYAPSAEIWVQEQGRASSREAVSYLGIAPDFSHQQQENQALSPLRFNQQEVQDAAKAMDGKALLGVSASELVIKQPSSSPMILHFATHALADETALLQSRLFLNPDTTRLEDGVLHAFEIYQLQLNSPLIVLSACQTGSGPVVKGEGVMSLARAFQYAGGQQVVTTLWNADDQASFRLVSSFFQALAKGSSPESALAQARQDWLATADDFHCHPYFWSGLVVIGEGGPLRLRSQMWFTAAGIAALLLVLGAGGWIFWKKGAFASLLPKS